jgi:glucan phosphoethanolaminetransferase (alkaline phosphatase superfamily)
VSELIVLGLIPGTKIQITFVLWIVLTIVLAVALLAWLGHRRSAFRNWFISISLLVLTKSPTRL